WQAIAPAMSMRCITVPPRMNPSGLASFGSTTCTISVADSDARFGSSALEVVADPDIEARLPEVGAAARRGAHVPGEHVVLPRLVEEGAPRPVEVDREPEEERLEAEPVRGAAVFEAEAVDDFGRPSRDVRQPR